MAEGISQLVQHFSSMPKAWVQSPVPHRRRKEEKREVGGHKGERYREQHSCECLIKVSVCLHGDN